MILVNVWYFLCLVLSIRVVVWSGVVVVLWIIVGVYGCVILILINKLWWCVVLGMMEVLGLSICMLDDIDICF